MIDTLLQAVLYGIGGSLGVLLIYFLTVWPVEHYLWLKSQMKHYKNEREFWYKRALDAEEKYKGLR